MVLINQTINVQCFNAEQFFKVTLGSECHCIVFSPQHQRVENWDYHSFVVALLSQSTRRCYLSNYYFPGYSRTVTEKHEAYPGSAVVGCWSLSARCYSDVLLLLRVRLCWSWSLAQTGHQNVLRRRSQQNELESIKVCNLAVSRGVLLFHSSVAYSFSMLAAFASVGG